mgnify:CR=1 FL=1
MYGVIDIGSNTIRLVIYKVDEGSVHSIMSKKYAAGLANYVNKYRLMNEHGILRLVEVLMDIEKIVRELQIDEVYSFGTAILRNIANADEVLMAVNENCSFDVKILTGREEAIYDYYGIMYNCRAEECGIAADIGGGSTEIAYFADRSVITACSIPSGSLNLYVDMVDKIIPDQGEISKMRKHVARQLNTMDIPKLASNVDSLNVIGGTARAILKLYNGHFDDSNDNKEFDHRFVKRLIEDAEKKPCKLARKILRSSPDRIHTIIPGAIIIDEVLNQLDLDNVIVSVSGVREGYLYEVLRNKGAIDERI